MGASGAGNVVAHFRLLGLPIAKNRRQSARELFANLEEQRHAGKQSQAPKQVLGVVTLHAVCDE